MENKIVRVGIQVVVPNNSGKIIIGKRKSKHGFNQYGFPGGHMEYGETVFQTAVREVYEETGLTINPLFKYPGYSENFYEEEGRHYITLFVYGNIIGNQTPELKEPDKCYGWELMDFPEIVGRGVHHQEIQLLGSVKDFICREILGDKQSFNI